MGRMSIDTRLRVVMLEQAGFTVGTIQQRLQQEGITVSKTALCSLLKKFRLRGTVRDLRWWKPPKIFQEVHYRFIERYMERLVANCNVYKCPCTIIYLFIYHYRENSLQPLT